jgi:hypothetical protein
MTLSIASLEAAAAETSQPFIDSTYYGEAEKWTALWWDDRLPFRAMFDRMALDFTIELAAGYGRHAEYSAPLAKQLLLMDVIERNLKICRVRLGERFPNVRYAVNNGFNYEPLGSGQASAIYCYMPWSIFRAISWSPTWLTRPVCCALVEEPCSITRTMTARSLSILASIHMRGSA